MAEQSPDNGGPPADTSQPGPPTTPAKRTRPTRKTTATAKTTTGRKTPATGKTTARKTTTTAKTTTARKTTARKTTAAEKTATGKTTAARKTTAAKKTAAAKTAAAAAPTATITRASLPPTTDHPPQPAEQPHNHDQPPPHTPTPLARRALQPITGHPLTTSLAAALTAAVTLLIITWLQLGTANALNHARTTALNAAKTYAVDIGSYNYRTLNKDFGTVIAHATPAFRQSYTTSSNALKTTLTKYNATAKATVISAGLVTATTTRAVALIALNQTVTNTTQKGKPTTSQSRLEITLLHTHGHWLINNVNLL